MNLFRINPTIRETNRYLNKTVEALLKKHGNVSNEEFEKELVAVTGIGWKRVKDYKNHPKPGQRLKDNSLVVKYVRECRRRDKTRRFIRIGVAVVGAFTLVTFSYYFLTKPKPVEQFVIHEAPPTAPHKIDNVETKVFIEVPSRGWLFRVGPMKHSKIPLDKFICAKMPTMNLTNCSLNEMSKEGVFQAAILIDGDIVRKFTVMTFNQEDIDAIRTQLAARVRASQRRCRFEN